MSILKLPTCCTSKEIANNFFQDDTVIFEVQVNAEVPQGVCRDSKKQVKILKYLIYNIFDLDTYF